MAYDAATGKTALEGQKDNGTACLTKIGEQRKNFACVRTSGNASDHWDAALKQWKMTGAECLKTLQEEPKCFDFLAVVADAQIVRAATVIQKCLDVGVATCPAPTATNDLHR